MKKFGAQITPALHRKLRRVSQVTGRTITSIIDSALRRELAQYPTPGFTTFEDMHARYEALVGEHVDLEVA